MKSREAPLTTSKTCSESRFHIAAANRRRGTNQLRDRGTASRLTWLKRSCASGLRITALDAHVVGFSCAFDSKFKPIGAAGWPAELRLERFTILSSVSAQLKLDRQKHPYGYPVFSSARRLEE